MYFLFIFYLDHCIRHHRPLTVYCVYYARYSTTVPRHRHPVHRHRVAGCKWAADRLVTEGSLFACNLVGNNADSAYASPQLVASASGTDHSVVLATVQSEPSGAFIPENSSVPSEVTQRCATRSTSNHLVLPHQQGTAAVPAVPSRSSVAERPAMRASHRPCTTIFMLQRVHRRP